MSALYHYRVQYIALNGQTMVSTGAVRVERPLETTADYDQLVDLMRDDMKRPVAKDFIMLNLSRLDA